MGIASLRKVLDPRPCTLEDFRGRVVAVDADNLLWMFVTAMAGTGDLPLGPDGHPVAHVVGLVNRLKLYADHGIASAWVFDGEQPVLKTDTLAERWARIEDARERGDSAAGVAVEERELRESRALLQALGVPWMVAPAESDAQCAHFARTGQAWAAVTQDYDIALHGAPRAGRNLSASTKRTPELLDLKAALGAAGLTREQLVDVALLIGTDYNDGVYGMGPVKAISAVKRLGNLEAVLAARAITMPQMEEVRELFLNHPVDKDARIVFRAPDESRARDLLDAAGVGRERGEALFAALGALVRSQNEAAPVDAAV